VSQNNPENNLSLLNPSFLQAVLGEASIKRKPDTLAPQARLIFVPEEHGPQTNSKGNAPKQAADAGNGNREEPVATKNSPHVFEGETVPQEISNAQRSKAEIAAKKADLAEVQRQLDKLLGLKSSADPAEIAGRKSQQNELRMKRLAIQMAIISGSGKYNDNDLVAVDKQIAAINQTLASNRQLDASSPFEQDTLNAKIEAAQSRKEA